MQLNKHNFLRSLWAIDNGKLIIDNYFTITPLFLKSKTLTTQSPTTKKTTHNQHTATTYSRSSNQTPITPQLRNQQPVTSETCNQQSGTLNHPNNFQIPPKALNLPSL